MECGKIFNVSPSFLHFSKSLPCTSPALASRSVTLSHLTFNQVVQGSSPCQPAAWDQTNTELARIKEISQTTVDECRWSSACFLRFAKLVQAVCSIWLRIKGSGVQILPGAPANMRLCGSMDSKKTITAFYRASVYAASNYRENW